MNASDVKILIADDEPDILEILTYNLSKQGYQVKTAKDGKEALKKAKKSLFHLIILDRMMPKMDGVEACKQIRKLPNHQQTIITFLTAVNDDIAEMESYQAGADDYITKPIRPKVLNSKIQALLRRWDVKENPSSAPKPIQLDDIVIDKEAYQLVQNDIKIHLPKKEFELLLMLAEKPGKVFSREEILNRVWGNEVVVGDRTIDVHIRKLREKIGADKIITITGIGYKYFKHES